MFTARMIEEMVNGIGQTLYMTLFSTFLAYVLGLPIGVALSVVNPLWSIMISIGILFGIGAGLLTVLIRLYGSYAEGVSFAILFMNILTPYLSRATMTKPFGGVRA